MDGRTREKPPKSATAAFGGDRFGAQRPKIPARKYFLCVFIARCTSRMPTWTPVKERYLIRGARPRARSGPVVKGRGKATPQRSCRRDFRLLPGSPLHRRSRPARLSRAAAPGARGPKRRDRRRRRPNDRCRAVKAGWPTKLGAVKNCRYGQPAPAPMRPALRPHLGNRDAESA